MLLQEGRLLGEPRTLEWPEGTRLPPVSPWLRTWLGLLGLDIPPLNLACKRLIRGHLPHCRGCSFSAGFRMLYGKIHAEGASFSNTCFIDYADVHVGRGTGFSFDNMVITSTHDLRRMGVVRAREVFIGENVWITSRVVILGGARIGDNSVIAAGSVVTGDIPANVLAAGVPARPLREVDRAAGGSR